MKTCGFENQINLYLDGELSGEKLRSFEAHLEACTACREEVEQYRGLLDELHGMKEMEVPPMLQARLHEALAKETVKGDGRVKRKLNPWALSAVAAVLVLVIGGAALLNGAGLGSLQNAPIGLTDQADHGSANMAVAAGEAPQMNSDMDTGLASSMEVPTAAAAATMAPQASESLKAGALKSTGDKFAIVKPDVSALPTQGSGSNPPQQTQTADSRKIIYTANLVVETREFNKCLSTVDGLYAKYGGYKASSQLTGVPDSSDNTTARAAVISIRIPLDKYNAAMSDLKAMGNVLNDSENTNDVSRDYVDSQARNKTLKDERDRLEELLAKADSMDNIIALQNQITDLTTQIEQETAQLNFWDDQVSYSTITVEIHELVTAKSVKPADPDMNSRVSSAFYGTLNSMKKGFENFEVSFIGFLPWLAIIIAVAGVAAAIAIPATRRARRAAAKRAATDKKEE